MSITPNSPADFSPTLEGYTGQGAFKFWCQQVLPLVFDDSISYYELLNKVVVYLNNVIQDVSAAETNISALSQAYKQLEDYVNDYFSSLDVQNEINNKLDAMAASGELTALIATYLDPIIAEQNQHIAAQFSEQNQNIANQTAFLQQKTNEQDASIAVLEGRMDTFAQLPTGSVSTAADAELVDIRVAYNGTTYPTAGDSVRSQATEMKNYINSLSGLINFYPDPDLGYLRDGFTGAKQINRYVYRGLNNAGSFVYNNGKATKPANTSGNKLYLAEIGYDSHTMGNTLTFGVNVTRSVSMTGNVRVYIRCFDSTNTAIGTDSSRSSTQNGILSVSRAIPGNTAYIQVWVSSESTNEWSFDSPVITNNAKMVEFNNQLWNMIMLDYKTNMNIAFVSNEAELLTAITNSKTIYLLQNITVTSDILITTDIEINGRGYTLSGSGLTSYLIGVQGGKVTIKNITLIGEQTVDYVVIPSQDSNVTLDGCVINTSKDSVVRCKNNSKVIIKNCDIGYSYQNDGVSPANSSNVYVYNSVMHDCYDEGLSSHNSSYTEVHGCEFYNNGYIVGTTTKGAPSSFGGCHIGGGNMGIVEGCYSHNNRTYGIALINFQMDLDTDIEKCYNNVVQDNGSHGIMCTYCKHLTLVNNSSIANDGDGIHFGVDPTQSDPQGVASSGYVAGNILFHNTNDNVVVDSGAGSSTLYIQ